MTTTVARAPHTSVLLGVLEDGQSLPVGDVRKPDGAGWQGSPGASDFVPYHVLHPSPGGNVDGSLGDPECDATLIFLLVTVGVTREQCEKAGDLARDAIRAADAKVEGRGGIRLSTETLGGARVDETVDPSVFISTERIAFITNAGSSAGS